MSSKTSCVETTSLRPRRACANYTVKEKPQVTKRESSRMGATSSRSRVKSPSPKRVVFGHRKVAESEKASPPPKVYHNSVRDRVVTSKEPRMPVTRSKSTFGRSMQMAGFASVKSHDSATTMTSPVTRTFVPTPSSSLQVLPMTSPQKVRPTWNMPLVQHVTNTQEHVPSPQEGPGRFSLPMSPRTARILREVTPDLIVDCVEFAERELRREYRKMNNIPSPRRSRREESSVENLSGWDLPYHKPMPRSLVVQRSKSVIHRKSIIEEVFASDSDEEQDHQEYAQIDKVTETRRPRTTMPRRVYSTTSTAKAVKPGNSYSMLSQWQVLQNRLKSTRTDEPSVPLFVPTTRSKSTVPSRFLSSQLTTATSLRNSTSLNRNSFFDGSVFGKGGMTTKREDATTIAKTVRDNDLQ